MQKYCKLGKTVYGNLFVTIEFDNKRLSITGVEGPYIDGNCRGGCGQIIGALEDIIEYDPKWDASKVKRLKDIWENWHLNDMRAGTREQVDFVRTLPKSEQGYDRACEHLKGAGLYEVEHNGQPYKYGQAWLFEEVPESVVSWLTELPETDKMPGRWKR